MQRVGNILVIQEGKKAKKACFNHNLLCYALFSCCLSKHCFWNAHTNLCWCQFVLVQFNTLSTHASLGLPVKMRPCGSIWGSTEWRMWTVFGMLAYITCPWCCTARPLRWKSRSPDVEGKCGKGHRQTRLLGLGVNRFLLLVQSLTEVFQQFVSRSLGRARCCVCSWQCDGKGK